MKLRHTHLNNVPYIFIYAFSIILIICGFIVDTPLNSIKGLIDIMLSPSNLLTDYIYVGGMGAAFLNSGLITLLTGLLLQRFYFKVTGPLLASIFTVAGFSFFGKNLFNSLSITLGVYVYSKITKKEFSEVSITAIFATCLAPLVSEIAFNTPFSPVLSLVLSQVTGLAVGILIYPLSSGFYHFHKGFSLYNVGFSAGVLGMIITGFLKMMNFTVNLADKVYTGDDTFLKYFIISFLLLILFMGIFTGKNRIKGLLDILKQSGRSVTDFIEIDGFSNTMVNMALVGFTGFICILILGASLNGPILGGLFTMIGFGAFGKTPKNIIPVIGGILTGLALSHYDISSTNSVLICLFGTSLAPISGYFGIHFGFLAGLVHTGLVNITGAVHSGLNLYNNGFSSGFTAGFITALIEGFSKIKISDDKDYNKMLNKK